MNESIATQQGIDTKVSSGLTQLRYTVDSIARRTLDVLISLVGIIVLLPALFLVAVIIKRDSPGPVFYWGERVGRYGRPFRILKFRTMYETGDSYSGPRVTGHGDPRITPFGQWLRETKVNELPQLWNVFKGDMSLVGPRPEDRDFVLHWPTDTRDVLLSVRPGITSPASVLYRDEESLLAASNVVDQYLKIILPSKLRLDLIYVRHRSFLTDLDVLFWTLMTLVPRLKTRQVPEHLLFWGPLARFISRYMSWFVLDSVIAFVAVATTGIIWRSSGPLELGPSLALGVALAIALVFSLVNAVLGVGRIAWSRADSEDAISLAISSGLTTAILLAANSLWQPRSIPVPYLGHRLLPSGLIVVSGLLAFAGFLLLRYRMRVITGLSQYWMTLRGGALAVGERVLIVGAGEAGNMAAYLLRKLENGQAFAIIGLVDDAPRKLGTRVGGLQVLGATADIPQLVRANDIGLVLFAIENIRPDERERILQTCRATGAQTVVLPDVLESLRTQLVSPAAAPVESVPGAELDSWLRQLDGLIAAEAWDAVREQVRTRQRQLLRQ